MPSGLAPSVHQRMERLGGRESLAFGVGADRGELGTGNLADQLVVVHAEDRDLVGDLGVDATARFKRGARHGVAPAVVHARGAGDRHADRQLAHLPQSRHF